MSLLFVDSGCDLGFNHIKMLGIDCININYSINDNLLTLSDDFDYDKFYSKYRKGVVVSGQSLSEKDYIEIFEPAIKGDDIVYVHSSKNLIDVQALQNARDELIKKHPERRLELIDSANISVGQGVLSYLIAKMYRGGATIDEMLETAESLKNEIATYMVIDSLEELSNNGKVNTNKVVGTALNIKPIVAIDIDGKIQIVEKVSGRKKAINKLMDIVRQEGENVIDYPIMVTHSHLDDDAALVVDKLKDYFGEDAQILESKMTPSNTAIFGLNAVGISFHVHSKIH